MPHITLAIADDQPVALKAITRKLAQFDDIEIKFMANNGASFLEAYKTQPADIVLMDIEMPIMGGISCTRALKEMDNNTSIIMLTTFDEDDKIFQAILAGASGYLLKEESGENIAKAIRDAKVGGAAMSPHIAMKALKLIQNQAQLAAQNEQSVPSILTNREIEILTALKDGLAYKQIAAQFFISEGTVRKHIENIYRKLSVNNKVTAINVATNNKWIK